MHSKVEKPGSGEGATWESFFAPRSREAELERRATKYVLKVYEETLRQEIDLHFPHCTQPERDALVDEWYALAICGDELPSDGDPLRYSSVLNSFAAMFAKVERLPPTASWNDIIVHEIGQFDGLIAQAVESNWSWKKLIQVYRQNWAIDTALRNGLEPDVSQRELLMVLEQKNASRTDELRAQYDVCDSTKRAGLNAEFISRMRQRLSNLWNRDPQTISQEEIDHFIQNHPRDEPPLDW